MTENSIMVKESIAIIGGGIGGLYSAWNLLKEGYQVTILERQNHLGGLSTSIPFNGFQMDVGPHFISAPKNTALTNEIQELMKDEIISVDEIHNWYRVFFNNSIFHEYPPLYDVIFRQGTSSFLHSIVSYIFSKIKNQFKNKQFQTAKDYIVANYGHHLYNVWFKPYLDFYYGHNEHSLETVQGKFPPLKFQDAFKKIKKRSRKTNQKKESEIYQWYFKNGMGSFVNILSKKIEELGGRIMMGVDIKNITHEKNKKEILIDFNGKEQKISPNIILYTTPSSVTKNWFSDIIHDEEQPKAGGHGILVYLFVNHPKIVDWWLIQNYDPRFSFFRITHQNYLSNSISPPEKSLLCIEINTKNDPSLWNISDEKIFAKVKNDLIQMNILDTSKIENFKIFKFKNLYVSSNPKSSSVSEQISKITKSFSNEFVIGVEIDPGTLVTKRVEESNKSEPKLTSLGGMYLTLDQSKKIVDLINSEKNIS